MTLRTLWFYLRSRRLMVVAAITILASAGAALYEHLQPGRVESILFSGTMPAVAVGICAGLGVYSPQGELDDGVFRALRPVRLAGFFGTLAFSMVAFAVLAATWDRPTVLATLGRDLLGFAGLTVMSIRLVGISRSRMPGFA